MYDRIFENIFDQRFTVDIEIFLIDHQIDPTIPFPFQLVSEPTDTVVRVDVDYLSIHVLIPKVAFDWLNCQN